VTSLFIINQGYTSHVISEPKENPHEWTSFWHPIFGTCYNFAPIFPIAKSIGDYDIDYLSLDLNFDAGTTVEKFLLLETWIFEVCEEKLSDYLTLQ
jgi:hypothetical protein